MRYEIKMTFDEQRLAEVRSWVLSHREAFQVAYPPRQVNNIYFDTFERALLQKHLDGVAERSKVRFRWYGASWQAKNGQLEIKRKHAQLGDKLTYPVLSELDLERQAWEILQKNIRDDLPDDSKHILDGMRPALINQYQREYYASMDGVLRVTLDFGLVTFAQTFGSAPNISFPQPLHGQMVIELKAPKEAHQRIADAMSAFPLYARQNSKYLLGMESFY